MGCYIEVMVCSFNIYFCYCWFICICAFLSFIGESKMDWNSMCVVWTKFSTVNDVAWYCDFICLSYF